MSLWERVYRPMPSQVHAERRVAEEKAARGQRQSKLRLRREVLETIEANERLERSSERQAVQGGNARF